MDSNLVGVAANALVVPHHVGEGGGLVVVVDGVGAGEAGVVGVVGQSVRETMTKSRKATEESGGIVGCRGGLDCCWLQGLQRRGWQRGSRRGCGGLATVGLFSLQEMGFHQGTGGHSSSHGVPLPQGLDAEAHLLWDPVNCIDFGHLGHGVDVGHGGLAISSSDEELFHGVCGGVKGPVELLRVGMDVIGLHLAIGCHEVEDKGLGLQMGAAQNWVLEGPAEGFFHAAHDVRIAGLHHCLVGCVIPVLDLVVGVVTGHLGLVGSRCPDAKGSWGADVVPRTGRGNLGIVDCKGE